MSLLERWDSDPPPERVGRRKVLEMPQPSKATYDKRDKRRKGRRVAAVDRARRDT